MVSMMEKKDHGQFLDLALEKCSYRFLADHHRRSSAGLAEAGASPS